MNSTAERDAAYQDIKSDGIAVTLSCSTPGTYNPATGGVTNTATTYSTYGLITDYRLSEIDGTLVKQGDKQVLLAATSGMPDPAQDDNLVIGGVTWSVVSSNPVAPAGVTILHKVQVRK